MSRETLILDFEKGCQLGDIHVIDAILASKHHEALSPFEIDAGLQLCALENQSTIVSMLLESPSLNGRLPPSGKEAFVVAAGDGLVKMMKLLTSYWTEELTTASSDAVIRSLVVACGNGHIDVVRYLVQHVSADINTVAHEEPVGPGLKTNFWGSSGFAIAFNDSESEVEPNQEKRTVVPVISPLQAALRGFSRFDQSRNYSSPISSYWEIRLRKADQSSHEEVIMFLIGNGSNLNDLGRQNLYPIQLAAKFYPIRIVEKMIAAGTDVNKNNGGKSALLAAAGRELSAAPIVRKLLAAGATIPKEIEKQKALLEQALRFFEGGTPRGDFHKISHPDGRFLKAPSLEYVFNEGSGAVLFELLHQMSQTTTKDIRWTLVLQMAALLDDHPFVDLLLSRGTDVNAIGYYYGTALTAAARCGYISMVQKLLDAGAEVNALGGRWQTALRAALVGGHEAVVETLLYHGADMEIQLTQQELHINGSEEILDNILGLGVQSGSLSIVKTLLKHGANAVHDETETLHPLILAAHQGSVAIVQELLDAGAPVNIPGKKRPPVKYIQAEYASPIHAAVARGHLDVIRLLLSRGPDIETNVEGSGTPLSVAASKGRADVVRLLISAGANVIDGTALYNAVMKRSTEIAQELLAAGSKAEPVLAFACRQGILPTIELLLEKVYDGEKPETVMDEVFATNRFNDSVYRLLLDYTHPTTRRFTQVCAAGSAATAHLVLSKGDIDINAKGEANGDYPLQAAAMHLQVEVVRFLLGSGAEVNCKSAKHGTPLITALEACAASKLRDMESEKINECIDQLYLPNRGRMAFHHLDGSVPRYPPKVSSFEQVSDCEHIVQLLIIHGSNIADDSRPFGSPMHLACLIGSQGLVKMLLEKGAELDTTAGFFEKTIFAAIEGGNPDIVELLLQKVPLTKHVHSHYATPLHLACVRGPNKTVRRLLEHGADATILDSKGRTPLRIALEKKKQCGLVHTDSCFREGFARKNKIYAVNEDLEIGCEDAKKTIALLLEFAKDMSVSERREALNHAYRSKSESAKKQQSNNPTIGESDDGSVNDSQSEDESVVDSESGDEEVHGLAPRPYRLPA